MANLKHTEEGEELLFEFLRQLNRTGDFIQKRTVFNGLLDFWQSREHALRRLPYDGVNFYYRGQLKLSESAFQQLVSLVADVGWPIATDALSHSLGLLFMYTQNEDVSTAALDHLCWYIAKGYAKSDSRIGVLLPEPIFADFAAEARMREHRSDHPIADTISSFVTGLVTVLESAHRADTGDVLAADMQAAFESLRGLDGKAGAFCIFDLPQDVKALLSRAAPSRFGNKLAAFIVQEHQAKKTAKSPKRRGS